VHGAIMLSTCNRTEFYMQGENESEAAVLERLMQERGLNVQQFKPHWFACHQQAAVKHVFRVATGLDSMVLGEPQILGQLKAAYQTAKSIDSLSPDLDRLLQTSFAVAKQVRTQTGLGTNAVSVASSAMRLCKRFFDDFEQRKALVIGAGDTAQLFAKHLRANGIGQLLLSNRTLSRAQSLAQAVQGFALPIEQMPAQLADVDLIVAATASTQPVLTRETLENAFAPQRRKMRLLLDLGVPRDIDPSCASLRDCYLFTVDDLKQVADEGFAQRKQAAIEAERVIDAEVSQFMQALSLRSRLEPMVALRQRLEAELEPALRQALNKLHSGADAETLLKQLHAQMLQKMLHAPTVAIKQALADEDEVTLQRLLKVYGLD
jgi:glutamyl-tRNA reductase